MSTQAAPVDAAPAGEKAKDKPKERRNVHVAFAGPDGSRLKITLKLNKDGSAVTYAVHSTKSGKKWTHVRGATTKHPSTEVALQSHDALVSAALKKGWTHRQLSRGFQAKADAFDAAHLPAPSPAKKK